MRSNTRHVLHSLANIEYLHVATFFVVHPFSGALPADTVAPLFAAKKVANNRLLFKEE